VRILRVHRKTAEDVTHVCTSPLKFDSAFVRTNTTDNGKEFAGHQDIKAELHACVYFAGPYASWQRGTNENTNGLIRLYIPKSRPLEMVTNQDIQQIEDRLNSRPRKALGFITPNEVINNHQRRVALRS